jgi:hypothetical protein
MPTASQAKITSGFAVWFVANWPVFWMIVLRQLISPLKSINKLFWGNISLS